MPDQDYYEEEALFERLTEGVARSEREVVFMLGSALTAPSKAGEAGVPGVKGIVELIASEFSESQSLELRSQINLATNPYQEAFRFLIGRRGPEAANRIIRSAIARARINTAAYMISDKSDEAACRSFDQDQTGWFLTAAARAIGCLAASKYDRFGRTILTTNFDPLIEVAVKTSGGECFRTILHGDGNLSQTEAQGSHVVHINGYWYGSDTLHTPRQLSQLRPQLKASLSQIIRNKTVVVMGYGGWDDTFAAALDQVVREDNAYPEIVWTAYDKEGNLPERLLQRLEPGLSRERVTLYKGIDCHAFLPRLADWWKTTCANDSDANVKECISKSPPIAVSVGREETPTRPAKIVFTGEENPPNVDFYVGRKQDEDILFARPFRVAFLCGMGGQGKSALAGSYFTNLKTKASFDYRLWRDCKEQSESFEDRVARLVESLSRGAISAAELANQSPQDLARLFHRFAAELRILIVFDNVDHYVDLEEGTLTGFVGEFVKSFLDFDDKCQILFTCRPEIRYDHISAVSHKLSGLNVADVAELFSLRRAAASATEMARAHAITGGHALWLDILAARVARYHESLSGLLNSIESGSGDLPTTTLTSIWNTLADRERIVLQTLAETLRPTTESQLATYLDSRIKYNRVSKAVRSLRSMNLIVVRALKGEDGEGLELHPLVRTFIRGTFQLKDRIGFIEAILQVSLAFLSFDFGKKHSRKKKPTAETFSEWLEAAELAFNAHRIEEALDLLSQVGSLVEYSLPSTEFIRICRQLFDSINLNNIVSLSGFERTFDAYVKVLTDSGKSLEAESALNAYYLTIAGKTARYIHYCNMRCRYHWFRHEQGEAVRWGQEGQILKTSTDVDTEYSTEHNLALALRDAGRVDEAFGYFLGDASIEEITKEGVLDDAKHGSFYGNIGRCLQLMGQIEPALNCYRKSAFLVERESTYEHVENQAFIRQWIGELLLAKSEKEPAEMFLIAAKEKWSLISPVRETAITETIRENFHEPKLFTSYVERYCLDWINT